MSIIQNLNKLKTITESLQKWERRRSMTMVNREAHYQALSAVKDHVLKYVQSLVEGMKEDEVKEIVIAGKTLTIRKIMNDMYSGKVHEGTDIIHEFDRITIPQLAGQLQSLLELYDPSSLKDDQDPKLLLIQKLQPFAEQAEDGMVSQLIRILSDKSPKKKPSKPEDSSKEIEDIIREANLITEEAKRNAGSPDPRKEIEELKERVQQILHRVESLVSQAAPTSAENDKLQDTLHVMQQKHDHLTDRVQQELNILEDRIAEVNKKIEGRVDSKTGKKIVISFE